MARKYKIIERYCIILLRAHKIATVLFLFFLPLYAYSISPQHSESFALVNNSVSDILGLRTVRAALLDKHGRMWVGTQSGLFLFDGTEVRGKPRIVIQDSHLWRADIASIKEDSVGGIWVLTANDGLYRFSEDDIPTETESVQYMPSLTDAHAIEITSDKIWVVDANGLHALRLTLGLPETSRLVYESKEISTTITKTNGGEVCIGEKLSILCWGDDRQPFSEYRIQSGQMNDDQVAEISALSVTKSEILIGTTRGKIYTISRKTRKLVRLCRIKSDIVTTVTSLKKHSVGIVVGTDKGLMHISKNRRHCSPVSALEPKKVHVTNSYEFDNHLWITTYTGVFTVTSSQFSHFSSSNSSIDNEVMSFAAVNGVGVFIGTYNGLYLQGKDSATFSEIALPKGGNGNTNKRVMALEFDGRRLWIGLKDGGILWYDAARQVFLDSMEEVRRFSITTMKAVSGKDMLIGTYGNGLWLFSDGDDPNNEVYQIGPLNKLHNVTVISPIDDRTVFVAAEFEPIFLCKDSELWAVCKDRPRKNFLSNSRILSSVIDHSSADMWIGTQNDGLYRYDISEEEEWKGEKVALASYNNESVFSVLKSADGGLWLATSNGLINYEPLKKKKRVYFAQDGLQDNDFNFGAALNSPDGNLYFGGSNGFNRFNPKEFKIKRDVPKVQFRYLQLGTSKFNISQSENSGGKFSIGYFDYFVRIFFHIPDFINAQGIKYRYKLDPFDPTWIDGGNDGSATYTNIPPGEYVFHVQGANSAGVWNRDGIKMNLKVLPPAWQTWWAYCLYALALYVILFMGKKWYDSNVLRVKATEMVREKTLAADAALDDMHEQLEAQDALVRNVRQRNIATLETLREIITHRADFLPDDVSAEIMRGSSSHVRALALLEQSLKYFNDRLFADLNAFTADCLSELSRDYASSHMVTTINEVTDELVAADDATLLAIIIYELVSNSFHHAFNENAESKYLRAYMKISKEKSPDSAVVELKVQDNGPGIPAGVAGELPGLSLVRKIVHHYSGSMETESRQGSSISITLQIAAHTSV